MGYFEKKTVESRPVKIVKIETVKIEKNILKTILRSLYKNCDVINMHRIFSTEVQMAYDIYLRGKTAKANSADKPRVSSFLKRLIHI